VGATSIDELQSIIQNDHAENSQCLSFMLAGEEYAVDILAVQEIRGWESATPIPNAPEDIKGIINLRGTIVPIIDMRKRFALDTCDYTELTVVIILKSEDEQTNRCRTIGIIVDAVSDVYDITTAQLRSAGVGENANSRYIKGLMSVKNRMLIFLDLHHLLSIH
jgi:purine-binding chemotaxis protein CheW